MSATAATTPVTYPARTSGEALRRPSCSRGGSDNGEVLKGGEDFSVRDTPDLVRADKLDCGDNGDGERGDALDCEERVGVYIRAGGCGRSVAWDVGGIEMGS
jgi:hypothetical protein